ncbi:EamA family transporter [Leptolyngbya sp. FACHB-16]|uniref:EamA family transporter n=1 Tax=unclassified Leptolyngbya TaxID=2650499 RepID=UPI001685346E|nr:DMT family transporter [Leptolyngbya sp. FACHB-16]
MIGILTVLLAAFVLTLHNIVVRVLFSHQVFLGLFSLGGYVAPTFHNSFLLMFMRMLLVVPLMASLAPKLHPNTTKDIQKLFLPDSRKLLAQTLVCGVLMFVYISILYVAIGSIPAGIALTLFSTYPVFTALLSWRFFGDRPTLFKWGVAGIILLGTVLTIPQSSAMADGPLVAIGVVASISSGVIYAFYSVLAQKVFEKLHPVSFTWMSFAMTLLLSGLSLLVYPAHDGQLDWTPLWIGGLLSGLFSFSGHVMHNLGIRMIGATTASMINSSSPAITTILAWAVIHETLNVVQMIGILVVTVGIVLLSSERVLMRRSQS